MKSLNTLVEELRLYSAHKEQTKSHVENELSTSNFEVLNEIVLRLVEELQLVNASIVSTANRQSQTIPILNTQIWNLKRSLFHPVGHFEHDCFNGQFSKQMIWQDLGKLLQYEVIIETGSYLGATAEFLARTGKRLYSIEVSEDFFRRTSERLSGFSNAHPIQGSSEQVVPIILDSLVPTDRTIFYLDAHWYDHVPLREEIAAIFSRRSGDIVMVDDFRVEGERCSCTTAGGA